MRARLRLRGLGGMIICEAFLSSPRSCMLWSDSISWALFYQRLIFCLVFGIFIFLGLHLEDRWMGCIGDTSASFKA